MGFLNLSLYYHPSGLAFDPAKVIERVRESFPNAEFLPGDQSQAEVQRAETLLADRLRSEPLGGPASKIIESLRRKARAYGPNFAFRIAFPSGEVIDGLVRSVGVQLLFKQALAPEVRQQLLTFLRRLGVGRLEEAKENDEQPVLLMDLPGPCSLMRNAPGVPWQEASQAGPPFGSEVG